MCFHISLRRGIVAVFELRVERTVIAKEQVFLFHNIYRRHGREINSSNRLFLDLYRGCIFALFLIDHFLGLVKLLLFLWTLLLPRVVFLEVLHDFLMSHRTSFPFHCLNV